MHKRFDHNQIEKKWQKEWLKSGIYKVGKRDDSKEKAYVLVEWPYPSGNLHIGHWYAFAVPDIYVRYQRMIGKQVMFPIGFDAFGLPAENAAIKHNVNPRKWTEGNIDHMKKQLNSMGNAFSWDKTTSSVDPDYYKWTQWMFTEFFKNDIAYRGEGIVNWCPGCNTVIANEQVQANGTCERCDNEIEKKKMPQWMLKITDFADDLIDDLNQLDWPEHIKEAQRNWIGRSSGAEIEFKLGANPSLQNSTVNCTILVFTTRPDTLYGVTFLAISPEKAQDWIEAGWQASDEIQEFAAKEIELRAIKTFKEDTDKRGVDTGITATNPANGEEISVWVVNYVLGDVGTGAIMAVPAHDERDFEFASKFGIDIRQVVNETESALRSTASQKIHTGAGVLINSQEFNGMSSEEAKEAITKKVGGKMTNTYRLRDWSIGRQRYWGVPIPIVYSPEGVAHHVPKKHLPWLLPNDVDFTPTGVAPLAKSEELKKRTEEIFGKGWTPEVETMDTFVDSSWYYLRYLDSQNDEDLVSQQAQKDWMPIDLYFGGAEHTTMHLLYSRFWQKALKRLGLVNDSEPYKKRVNRGLILGPDGNKMSKSKGNVVDPDKQVELVGADTVKMYLAFMGPYGEAVNYPWDLGGIAGLKRFLERVYGLRDHVIEEETKEVITLLHKTIKKVTKDIENFKFNTAISALMIFVNKVEKVGLSKRSLETFIKLLAPFAPYLTEEIWSELALKKSVHSQEFPKFDPSLIIDLEIEIGVQINGKMRGSITLAPEDSEEEAMKKVALIPQLNDRIIGLDIKKIIYVPGRILNLIINEKESNSSS